MIELFTDGAASGNPGAGGYGVILKYGTYKKEFSEGFRKTTNNRMELLAVIVGLEKIKKQGWHVKVISDSKYVVDAVEKGWLQNWQLKQFKGKKNPDLWKRYLEVAKKHNVKFQWVKGHMGHAENEHCDKLAVNALKRKNLKIDKEYEKNH